MFNFFYCSLCNFTANNSPANKFVGYGASTKIWSSAQAYCRQHHTDLATPDNEADITLLKGVLNSIQWTGAWFGLTRDTWKWSDGTQPLNLPWLSGHPDDSHVWGNCGAAQNGLLEEENCINQYYFVCSACECFFSFSWTSVYL